MADVEEQVEIIEQEEEILDSASSVKLFGKWTFKDVNVHDISLQVRRGENIVH